MHGCLDGAGAFATDAMQVFGPAHRDANAVSVMPFGTALADRRLQHEVSCVAIQSLPVVLRARRKRSRGDSSRCTRRIIASASSDGDLTRLDDVAWPERRRDVTRDCQVTAKHGAGRPRAPIPSCWTSHARTALSRALSRGIGWTASCCPSSRPTRPHNRHVVLRDKERIVTRRHGALLRSGSAMLPDEATLCATCWMHGVFAAQLTIGNTSFHKLFSVSRDPYNIMRASGLRVLIDTGERLASADRPVGVRDGIERLPMDLRACRSRDHRARDRGGRRSAMQWRITVDGAACRFLVFGHLVLGEREFEHAGSRRVDAAGTALHLPSAIPSRCGGGTIRMPRITWSRARRMRSRRSAATNCSTPMQRARERRACRHQDAAPTREFCFAVVGSLTDPADAARLATKYEQPRDDGELLAPAHAFWSARHARRRGSPATGRDVARARRIAAVARARRDDPSDRAARAGAVHRCGVGHARRLPGAGRILSGARARRAGQGRSCASSSRSSTRRAATGRNGSCSSPTRPSRTGTATATSSSGR